MLIDDLSQPWWTAVEMSSCLVQGAILGIRMNSLAVCRGQLWALAVHCCVVFGAAVYFRPCGAILSNVFLILSKLGAFVIAVLLLLHSLTLSVGFASGAEFATNILTDIATVQTVVQIVTAVLLMNTSSLHSLLRWLRRSRHQHADHPATSQAGDNDLPPGDQIDNGDLLFNANLKGSLESQAVERIDADYEGKDGDEYKTWKLRVLGGASGSLRRRDVMEHLIVAVDGRTTKLERLDRLVRAAALQRPITE